MTVFELFENCSPSMLSLASPESTFRPMTQKQETPQRFFHLEILHSTTAQRKSFGRVEVEAQEFFFSFSFLEQSHQARHAGH
jgi:hypothetical protein